MLKPNHLNDLHEANAHDRNQYVLRHLNRLAILADSSSNNQEKTLYLLISIENQLALGQVKSALSLVRSFDYLKDSPSSLLKASYYQAQGLALLYQNHIIESLEAFDYSMDLSKSFDDLYLFHHTRLYKEMALIKFYEPLALQHLMTYLQNHDFFSPYEMSMMVALYFSGINQFHQTISSDTMNFLDDTIQRDNTGPYVLYLMNKMLYINQPYESNQAIHEMIIALLIKTQGIKGDYQVIDAYLKQYDINNQQNASLILWQKKYITPLMNQLDNEQKALFSHLPDEPKVSVTSCLNCDNRCCYDGVYATYAEEIKINEHINKYPDEFTHVPKEFLEDGEWEFLFGGKRTKRVPHHYSRSDYPAHFEKTICIFALEDGACSLQKSAIKHDLHPWHLKPELCWKFPLIGLFNDNAYEHPHYFGEKDPHYFDESQPGYLSFLPCSKVTDEGISWKKMYKNELQYYLAKEYKQKK